MAPETRSQARKDSKKKVDCWSVISVVEKKSKVPTSTTKFRRIGKNVVPTTSEVATKTESVPERFCCTLCRKEFTNKAQLERHRCTSARISSESATLECDFCRKNFSRRDKLEQHLKKHIKREEENDGNGDRELGKNYVCENCHKAFVTPSHLTIHRRIHTGERPFKCDRCNKSFTYNGALKKHIRVHTGERPFKCSECEKSFALKGTLNRHIKIHTGNKPHKCSYCGKQFIQSGLLKAHLVHHTQENGFKCNQCDGLFNRKARLEMHIRYKHLKLKPFICDTCQNGFTRKEDLDRHVLMRHSEIRNHECEYCGKRFALKSILKDHMLTHQKEVPCTCKKCGHDFIRKDCLIRHIRKAHREEADILLAKKEPMDFTGALLASDNRYELVNGKLSDNMLGQAIRDVLCCLVDPKLLNNCGWPHQPVDILLESLIKQCSHQPVRPEHYNYYERLRENAKIIFTVVIEDETIQETLNNKTIDALMIDVINEARVGQEN